MGWPVSSWVQVQRYTERGGTTAKWRRAHSGQITMPFSAGTPVRSYLQRMQSDPSWNTGAGRVWSYGRETFTGGVYENDAEYLPVGGFTGEKTTDLRKGDDR